jgi:hypothetical protein
MRLVFDDEEGDRERILKVDGRELGGRGAHEREIAAVEGLAQPPVVAA